MDHLFFIKVVHKIHKFWVKWTTLEYGLVHFTNSRILPKIVCNYLQQLWGIVMIGEREGSYNLLFDQVR